MDDNKQQIAVIYERIMYHMRLGTQPTVRGKEEYVVTFPGDISKEQLALTLLTVAEALNAASVENVDHELRDPDTWSYRIVPVRFPMEAYMMPAKAPETVADAAPDIPAQEGAEQDAGSAYGD